MERKETIKTGIEIGTGTGIEAVEEIGVRGIEIRIRTKTPID